MDNTGSTVDMGEGVTMGVGARPGMTAGGWERSTMSSMSLSSWSLVVGWEGGEAQWWLDKHLTWKKP